MRWVTRVCSDGVFYCVCGFLEFQSVKFWLEILSQQNVSHNFGLKFYAGLAWSTSVLSWLCGRILDQNFMPILRGSV